MCARGDEGAASVEVGIEKGLNAGVRGTEAIAQQLILLIIVPQQRAGELEEISGRLCSG